MPRQSVFGIVHRKNPPGAEVLYGPLQIGRKHVDIAPILAVLAVFEHGDIQIRKLACDVGEMGIVPAVAAEENPLRRSFDDERSPQRPVRPKRTSGKVPRGTAIYRKAAAERSRVPTLPGSCTRSSARYRPPVCTSSKVCTGVRKTPNTP